MPLGLAGGREDQVTIHRFSEEIVIRGAIAALEAHRYILTPAEAAELVEQLTPFVVDEAVPSNITLALDYLRDDDECDPGEAAHFLDDHLAFNLRTVEEAFNIENEMRQERNDLRRAMGREIDPDKP